MVERERERERWNFTNDVNQSQQTDSFIYRCISEERTKRRTTEKYGSQKSFVSSIYKNEEILVKSHGYRSNELKNWCQSLYSVVFFSLSVQNIYISLKCDGVIPGAQTLNSIGDIEKKHLFCLYLTFTQWKMHTQTNIITISLHDMVWYQANDVVIIVKFHKRSENMSVFLHFTSYCFRFTWFDEIDACS